MSRWAADPPTGECCGKGRNHKEGWEPPDHILNHVIRRHRILSNECQDNLQLKTLFIWSIFVKALFIILFVSNLMQFNTQMCVLLFITQQYISLQKFYIIVKQTTFSLHFKWTALYLIVPGNLKNVLNWGVKKLSI